MEYYYKNNHLTFLTFPFARTDCKILFESEIDRQIKISDDILIINTVQGRNCLFIEQLKYNNITFLSGAIEHIPTLIKAMNKPYVLVLMGPTMFVDDLSVNFLKKFKQMKTDIIFGTSLFGVNERDLFGIKALKFQTNANYIDPTLCFGQAYAVSEFFEKYKNEKTGDKIKDFENTFCKIFLNSDTLTQKLDTSHSISYAVDFMRTQIREDENKRYIYETIGWADKEKVF